MASIYKVKKLFSGAVIGKDINKTYIAVPDSYEGKTTACMWNGEMMMIRDWKAQAETFRTFEDKFKRGKNYTLGYFEWKPKQEI